MQTNGTTPGDEWRASFKEHDFLIGLIVDGPKQRHDAYRLDQGGQGAFDWVKRGRELLAKNQVDANILCPGLKLFFYYVGRRVLAEYSHPSGSSGT